MTKQEIAEARDTIENLAMFPDDEAAIEHFVEHGIIGWRQSLDEIERLRAVMKDVADHCGPYNATWLRTSLEVDE